MDEHNLVVTNNTEYALRGSVISFNANADLRLSCNDKGIIISDNNVIITNYAPSSFTVYCYYPMFDDKKIAFHYNVLEKVVDNNLMLVNLYKEVDSKLEGTIKLEYLMGKRVSTIILPDLVEFIIDAYRNGIYIYIDSAYRSNAHQKLVYEKYKSRAIEPGKSEHETGLAVDILWGGVQSVIEREKSKEYKWLIENCINYGFILRYPNGKKNITGIGFEPWHFRWIGKKYAQEYIKGNYETFEEFVSSKCVG